MDLSEFILSDSVDLTNCDREAIHIPGATQPHGVLFVLSEPDLDITQASKNTVQLLGIEATALLGQSLATLLEEKQLAIIHACLQREFDQPNPLKLTVQAANGQAAFNGIVHRSTSNHVILELEPLDREENGDFLSFYQLTIATLDRIQRSAHLIELSSIIAEEIRRITGFDRVMVYRLGEVIAEAKQDELEPFLGLHYPHTDIPKQARRLYLLNPLRLIPDVNYEPVAIVGEETEAAEEAGEAGEAREGTPHTPHLWGLLDAHQCSTTRQWLPTELELMEQLAVQLAIAIRQAELYRSLENRVVEPTVELQQANDRLQIELLIREQATRALRVSEEQFQAFMDHNPAPSWITDGNGKILYINRTYRRTFQLPEGDPIGKTVFDLYPKTFAQHFFDNIRAVVETNQVVEAIEVAPLVDGRADLLKKGK